jgi:5-methylcytosine-specific restriction enzyme A
MPIAPPRIRADRRFRIRYADTQRGTSTARGYGAEWRTRRGLFLDRYPLCGQRPGGQAPVMSRCFPRAVRADQVDHVIPHRGDPRLFWDEDGNWQALCRTCGARKSGSGL